MTQRKNSSNEDAMLKELTYFKKVKQNVFNSIFQQKIVPSFFITACDNCREFFGFP